jgi:hypothetical protein
MIHIDTAWDWTRLFVEQAGEEQMTVLQRAMYIAFDGDWMDYVHTMGNTAHGSYLALVNHLDIVCTVIN